MKKIPFNIKYKQGIIDGKVKVFTKNGSPVEIVYWNLKNVHYDIDYPILAVVNGSNACTYTKNGTYSSKSLLNGLDLVIEVPEPKFKEGDKIVDKDGRVCTIIDVTNDILSNGHYVVRYTDSDVWFNIIMLEDEDKYHLYQGLPEWEKDNTSSTKLKPYVHYKGYKISLDEIFEKLPKKELLIIKF